ncbi:ATP-binding protein, partial [Salmonella enterica subsp. enterica serovar Panama]
TEVIKQLVVCEKHGDYEQRQRVSTGLVRLPGAPTSCPGCLKDELVFLRNEKAKTDDRTRTANVERLMLELKVPARFEACTLDN